MSNHDLLKNLAADPDALSRGRAAIQSVMERSATDVDFRNRLLDQPRETLAEEYGAVIPVGLNIKFVPNDADVTLVLPDPIDPEAELSEAEMEAVAGGATSTPMCVYITIMGTLAIIDKAIDVYEKL